MFNRKPSFLLLVSAGIWAGMRTVRYFDGKTYKWVGLSRQPNIIGKVSLALISHHEIKLIVYSVP